MDIEHIPLALLESWPGHVRKGTPVVDDLVASIRAEGLLQPLIVIENGSGYEVVAGNRRLVALQKLAASQPAFPPEATVPCHVLPKGTDPDKLLEISLAENTQRLDMHPMDECEAFATLAADGKDLPGIAAAFHVSERFVKQRLVLAGLPAKAREAYRKDEIDYKGAVALARLGDPKQVAKAMKIGKGWNGDYEHAAAQLQRQEKRFYVKHGRFPATGKFKIAEDLFDVDKDGKPAGEYYVDYSGAMSHQSAWLAERILELAKDDQHKFVELRPDQGFFSAYRSAEDSEKKGVGIVVWIEPSGEVKELRAVSLKSERQHDIKLIKEAKKKALAKKAEKGEKINAGEISAAFGQDLEQLHRIAVMNLMASDAKLFAQHLKLVSIYTPGYNGIDEIRAVIKAAEEPLLNKTDNLAAQLATFIMTARLHEALGSKAIKEKLDLGAVDWPKKMLSRLPRVMLEAEAKALKLKLNTGAPKGELVELVWKHKPKGWVPQYARL